jgi:hypothetical protein
MPPWRVAGQFYFYFFYFLLLERLTTTRKTVSYDNRCPDCVSNRILLKYNSGEVSLHSTRSVTANEKDICTIYIFFCNKVSINFVNRCFLRILFQVCVHMQFCLIKIGLSSNIGFQL